MTKKQWTTRLEFGWLESQIPDYLRAKGKKKTTEFFRQVCKKWWQEFPVENPTLEEVEQAGGNREKATDNKKKLIENVSLHI